MHCVRLFLRVSLRDDLDIGIQKARIAYDIRIDFEFLCCRDNHSGSSDRRRFQDHLLRWRAENTFKAVFAHVVEQEIIRFYDDVRQLEMFHHLCNHTLDTPASGEYDVIRQSRFRHVECVHDCGREMFPEVFIRGSRE